MSPNKKHPKFSGEKNTWYAFEEICQLSFSSREKFLNLLEAAVCNETSIKSDSEINFALQINQLWLLRVFLRTDNSTLLEDMFFSFGTGSFWTSQTYTHTTLCYYFGRAIKFQQIFTWTVIFLDLKCKKKRTKTGLINIFPPFSSCRAKLRSSF